MGMAATLDPGGGIITAWFVRTCLMVSQRDTPTDRPFGQGFRVGWPVAFAGVRLLYQARRSCMGTVLAGKS